MQDAVISREAVLMTIKWRRIPDSEMSGEDVLSRGRAMLLAFMQEHADIEEVALERMVWMTVQPDDIGRITEGG